MKTIKNIIAIFLIFFFCVSPLSFAYDASSSYVWSIDNDTTSVNSTNAVQVNSDNKETTSLSLESGSAILIEQSTGQVLYEQNAHEPLHPASVTKVMSILLIMEALERRNNFFK